MKKAQVTIFVIIGLIVLIIIAFALYMVSLASKPPDLVDKYTTTVPPALEPLKSHLEQCLLTTAKDGFIIAGQHGGYVYPTKAGVIPLDSRETSSNGVHFVPGTNMTIPYWYYMSSSNRCAQCQFKSERPLLTSDDNSPLDSIEKEVETYIAENFEGCVDFSEFEKRGFNVRVVDETDFIVKIGEDDVELAMDYPIEIDYNDQIVKIDKYYQKLELDIKSIYDVATALWVEWQLSDYHAFEYSTMQLISAYGVGQSDYDLPPIGGPTVTGFSNPDIWLLSDVRSDVKSIVTTNIPFVQAQNSEGYNLYSIDNQFSESFYNNFIFPVRSVAPQEMSRFQVNFDYLPWWEMYMDVDPSKGQLIAPDAPFRFNLLFFSFSSVQYDFAYDISYPVVISIEDQNAFDGDGYTFRYAYEVNIRNNNPLNTSPFNIEREDEGDRSLFDNENQQLANVFIDAKDALTGEPLDNVLISYYCGQDYIFIGETLRTADKSTVAAKLPKCYGGVLVSEYQGYVSEPYPLSIIDDEVQEVTLELFPIVEKKIEVLKRPIQKTVVEDGFLRRDLWVYLNQTAEDVSIDDQIIIVMERVSPYESSFVGMQTFMGDDSDDQTIDLTVGEYTVEVIIMRMFGENYSDMNLKIDREERCEDGGLFHGDECYTLPEVTFNGSIYVGGISMDQFEIGSFNITEEDLGKDLLTFYVPAINLDNIDRVEDLEQLEMPQAWANAQPTTVQPEFS